MERDSRRRPKPRLIAALIILVGISLLLIGFSVYSPSISFAQESDEKEYVGSRDCGSCHRDTGRAHLESRHALTLREAKDDLSSILADFGQGDDVRTVQFPNEQSPRPFTADDVALVIGTGRHVQRYVFEAGRDEYYVFPAEWNTASNTWQPYTLAESWTDPAYDFVQNCAGCHTTALNARRASWEDAGVQCEACHGPGSLHADAADDAGNSPSDQELREIRTAIVNSPDAQVCGQCHSQGTSADHPYPDGYIPGSDLLADFALVAADDPTHWWVTGHAKQPNMQFNEWLVSGHSQALNVLKGNPDAQDSCLECHSSDYRYTQSLLADETREGDPPDPITLQNAQFGITCNTCHDPHSETQADFLLVKEPYALCADCHHDTELTAPVHHPSQELFEGQTLVENITAIPSSHFEAGALCTTCHMPDVPTGAESRFSHSLVPTLPSTDASTPLSVCSTCHADLSTEYMQQFIQETQSKISSRLNAIDTAAEAHDSLPGWVLTVAAAVRGDGSQGLHNYAYSDALLDSAEVELGLVEVNSTTVSSANHQLADPSTCNDCHRDEYRQWEASPHAQASLNDPFLQEYASQGRPDFCMNCHASGYNPQDGSYTYEGVTCAMCHTNVGDAEHPPAPVESPTDSQTCGQCHSGAHAPTYDEWLVSDHRAAGIDCVDCHTPHNNGLLLETVNATCGDCHQEALVDPVHMGEDMTCTDCHLTRRTTQNGVHVISTGHTMSIDPSICAECHGNTHLLSVSENRRPPEQTSEIQRLQGEVDDLKDESDRNLNSGLVGGALGTMLLVVVIFIIVRLRRLL